MAHQPPTPVQVKNRIKLADGGILDKGPVELLQLGNIITIAPAPSSVSALGLLAAWVLGSNENPGPGGARATALGVVMQGRSLLPDHPEMLAVNINPPIINQEGLAAIPTMFDLKVRASWGVGADRCTAAIDVINGAQFSVVATELVIEGVYTMLDLQASTGIPIEIGANIGSRTRPGSAFGPSFTSYVFSYAAGPVPQDILIPSFAKAVTVYPGTVAGAPVAVTIGFVQGNAAAPSVSILQAANGCPCTYPLPNSLTRLRLTPTNVNDRAIVRFDLAL